mgnify:CR=1 FL=1
MHLIILLFFLNVLFAGEHSQKDLTFEFIYDSDEIFIDQDSVASFSGSLINISSDPIQISILRRVNVDQEDWSSSICIGSLCYSEWVDSVAVSIESGDTASLGVLVWTNGEGEDVIELDLFDTIHKYLAEYIDLCIRCILVYHYIPNIRFFLYFLH